MLRRDLKVALSARIILCCFIEFWCQMYPYLLLIYPDCSQDRVNDFKITF